MWFLQLMRSAVLINVFFWALALSVSVAGSNSTLSNRPFSNNVRLKILPLGDSITFGFQSTDGNGYRKHLLDKITTNGTAQYVGSVRSGNMTDNHNEGHPGATITQIGNFSRGSLTLRPNLILLMAGTNDMNMNLSVGATERLENLIDMCSTTCPDAVILVTQLSPAAPRDVEARIEQFNPTVIRLVANREGRGMKVAVVDMPKFVTTADLKDELHPNDIGYAKMADAWFEGIQKATTKGWFTPPIDANGPPQVVGVASVASATRSYLAPTPSLTTSSINTTANPSRFAAFAIPSNDVFEAGFSTINDFCGALAVNRGAFLMTIHQ
ncbi:SGNH hydrolase-type esterase domain-containing protein [Rhexocercosporidium sp. MPI-PUGE-AT-0058]|nr:SGNH hydrolase-type esterase domain-containing protein [Rhexocercosporidium sp. MPI-PUGE-AT-0058]